jgi:hypothetical protein
MRQMKHSTRRTVYGTTALVVLTVSVGIAALVAGFLFAAVTDAIATQGPAS